MTAFFLTAICSYLVGSVPFGYLLVRLVRGQDIRDSGSGNIGATNVARSSPGLGLLTLLLDAGKGMLAVFLALLIHSRWAESRADESLLLCVAALFAILGHMFPAWLNFRGGKGVATALGSFVLIAPRAVLVSAVIFVVIVAVFRYVSLASIIAVALFPLLVWRINAHAIAPGAIAVMGGASVLIVARHHENIRRLLAGTESRFRWRRG